MCLSSSGKYATIILQVQLQVVGHVLTQLSSLLRNASPSTSPKVIMKCLLFSSSYDEHWVRHRGKNVHHLLLTTFLPP